MNENTPEEFYRGISGKDWVTEQGYPTEAAFSFDPYDRSNRTDDYRELSINWSDSEEALQTLLSQRKPHTDVPQFKFGYCKIQKKMMLALMDTFIKDGLFYYERDPIEENEKEDIQANPFHGNLLMKKTVSNAVKKNIQCTLATLATGTFVPRQEL